MTDDTLNAILRRVIMEPDEDTHRLVYADRLDELGCASYAAHVRWAVVHPQISGVCLCVDPRQRPCDRCLLLRNPVFDAMRRQDGESHYVEHRGFVNELRMGAVTFLNCADALIWHETQTVACPLCRGHGVEYVPDLEQQRKDTRTGCKPMIPRAKLITCPNCTKGRVPRPCPPTAQPIRVVVLTTEPAFLDHGDYFTIQDDPTQERVPAGVMEAVVPDSLGEVCFRYRFPGDIEFEFPSSAGGTEAQSDDGDQDDDSGPKYITGNTWK